MGRAFSDIDFELSDKQAGMLKSAHEQALEELCDFAVRKKVDFILIAGDTFDDCEHDLHSRLTLYKSLKRLEEENISVFMVCGNHDPQTSYSNELEFKNSSKIKVFGVNCKSEPTEVVLNDVPVAKIYPFGFKTNQCEVSPCEFLSKAIDKNSFNIGLIHCDMTSDKNVYAPCSEKELLELDYDYYALGHIHKPFVKDKFVYSGTIQGRSRKDVGEHGFRLITVENNQILSNEFVPCDKVRYFTLDYQIAEDDTPISTIENLTEILTQIAQNCDLSIVHLTLKGVCKYAKQDLNELKRVLSSENVIVNEIIDQTIPNADEDAILSSGGMLEQIVIGMKDDEILANVLEDTKKEISETLKLVSEFDDNEILELAKTELKYICAEIYGNSEGTDE